jgi:glycosyltransferase involved in cell wall biosynthesis
VTATDSPAVRVVYLVPDHPWPARSGGQVRAAGIATALRELGHVSVLSPDGPSPSADWQAAVDRLKRRRASQLHRAVDAWRAVLNGTHIVLERAISAGLPLAFAELLVGQQPTHVVLGRPFFGPFLAAARAAGATVIVEADESLVRVARSLLRSRAAWPAKARAVYDLTTVGRLERTAYRKADQVWVSSEVERGWFSRRLGSVRIRLIPNLAPGATAGTAPMPITAVAFVGYFAYPPNEDAALVLIDEVMPAIRASGGPDELRLIGRSPTTRMRKAASGASVQILGEVDDTSEELRRAGLMVAPIRAGAGSRVKILEAMNVGVPVVASSRAIEGMPVVSGVHLLTAETPAEFASAVQRLVEDAGLRQRLASSAAAHVAANHSQGAVLTAVREAFSGL